MKFKIGDKVRIVEGNGYFKMHNVFIGDILVITSLTGDIIDKYRGSNKELKSLHGITFDLLLADTEITHVRIKDTRLARKVHRNNIEKIEDNWIYLK